MKIFVSYSRRDADLAQHVNEYFTDSKHDIFTDVNSIQMGDIWSNIIENNISKCDIFVVIVTQTSLRSIEIEKEVLQARRENRKIIPCIHRDVRHAEIKWDLAKLQGIEFDDKYELARKLFSKIERSIRLSLALSYQQSDSINTNTNASLPTRSITSSIDESRHYYHNREAIGVKSDKVSRIERYSCARFPAVVVKDEVVPLEVTIRVKKPSAGFSGTARIVLKKLFKQREIPVNIIVECSNGFEIVGKYYSSINVPAGNKDSKPLIFYLKAKKLGTHEIVLRFYQKQSFVGEIAINSTIMKTSTYSENREWISNDAFHEHVVNGPDMTILIREKYLHEEFEYDVLVLSKDNPVQEMGPIRFTFNPEKKFQQIFDEIENLSASLIQVDNKLKAKGMSLYDELFPLALKQLYWKKRDSIKSIRIISKEPFIPWEIIKPWHKLDNGQIEEDDFLCERYAFSRWLLSKPETSKQKIRRIKVIVPDDTDLGGALKEAEWIRQFARKKDMEVTSDSTYEELLTTLERTDYDIDLLHFSTHGQKRGDSSILSTIALKDGVQFTPEEIVGKATAFGQSHPVVILNACHTGYQGFYLTGIQGWATKFLDAGACIFLGALWSVTDEAAYLFIQELYHQLSKNTTLGESVRQARIKCKQPGDTSWLAYQLYGHPNSTIKFGC